MQRNSPVVKIDGFETVPANDENALLKAVANQPVSIAIDASGSNFQFYSEVKPLFCKNNIYRELRSLIGFCREFLTDTVARS